MPDRVMIFIDGSNIYHSLKDRFARTDLDFGKFAVKLTNGRELRRTYYYNALVDQVNEPDRYRSQQSFFAGLRRVSYFEVRLGRLVYRNWPTAPPFEKGIDVRLALDMLTHAYRNNFETAILVSGDNDFSDLVQAVKDLGKHVEVALFDPPTSSRQLREAADRVVGLDAGFLNGCWI